VFARSSWAVSASRIYPCCHARASERVSKRDQVRARERESEKRRKGASEREPRVQETLCYCSFSWALCAGEATCLWADELQEIEILKKTSKF
jgi:hypothetical protein